MTRIDQLKAAVSEANTVLRAALAPLCEERDRLREELSAAQQKEREDVALIQEQSQKIWAQAERIKALEDGLRTIQECTDGKSKTWPEIDSIVAALLAPPPAKEGDATPKPPMCATCGALAREVLELRRDRDILDWLESNPDDFWWSTAEFPTLRAAVTSRMSSPDSAECERP